jgi:hypothetical protein
MTTAKDSYRIAAWGVGMLAGVVAAFALYARGWDAGEKSGRMWGEITGQYKGMAALTNVMTRARFKDVER